MQEKTNDINEFAGLIKGGLVGLGILILLVLSAYTIDAGERGVLLTFGKPSMDAIGEGLHLKFPLAQKVVKYNVKSQLYEVQADSISADLQAVITNVALTYRPISSEVPKIHQDIGVSYIDIKARPPIQQSVKAAMPEYKADELAGNRDKISAQIKDALTEKLEVYGIMVDDFNIMNYKFSDEFNLATEARATAQQKREQAEMDLQRIVIEKEQIITQAQAQAESLRLQKMEITPDLIKLRQIEVQRVAIDKWNGVLPQVTGGAIPFIDMRSGNQTV